MAVVPHEGQEDVSPHRRDQKWSCPRCGSPSVRVVDSRPTSDGLGRKRRRSCLEMDCKHRWTTVELPLRTVRNIIQRIKALEAHISDLRDLRLSLSPLLLNEDLDGDITDG